MRLKNANEKFVVEHRPSDPNNDRIITTLEVKPTQFEFLYLLDCCKPVTNIVVCIIIPEFQRKTPVKFSSGN